MSIFIQIITITLMNIRNIPTRLGSSIVAIVGAAGVVAVLVAVMAMVVGFGKTIDAAGDVNHAIVLRGGSNSELTSGISGANIDIIKNAPGIRKHNANALMAPQVLVVLDVPKRGSASDANLSLRGVTAEIYTILESFQIVEGRLPTAGKRELIVGRTAASQFAGLSVGNTIGSNTNTWKVVGIFSDNGSIRESEAWADAAVVQDAYRRGNFFNSVLLKLESPDALVMLSDALAQDPRLDVSVVRETDYYKEQSRGLTTFISVLGYTVAFIMAIGAIFASVNTMYSAISTRSREIGTLRALGFGNAPIVISVLIEAVLLTVIGGIIGGTLSYIVFNGVTVSTLNFESFSQVAFAFAVTPELLLTGISWAIVIGLLGGLFPAIRAASIPITAALRHN